MWVLKNLHHAEKVAAFVRRVKRELLKKQHLGAKGVNP